MTIPIELCPHCDTTPIVVRERRAVPIGNRRVEIDDEYLKCPECDEEFYTSDLAERRQRLAVERARTEDNLLTPAQIKSVRERLGLSQRLFEEILGVGEKTCVRWEQGRVCQNVATDRLMRLVAADRENVARLAVINAVVLPDSCFVPQTQASAPTYAGALAAWEREASPHDVLHTVTVAGTRERGIKDTAEHEAIIAGATSPIAVLPIPKTAGTFDRTSARLRGILQ